LFITDLVCVRTLLRANYNASGSWPELVWQASEKVLVTPAKLAPACFKPGAGVQVFNGFIDILDSGLHWKLLLRSQYFRRPWRSRRNDEI
jgi:hypothetical protein